MSDRDELMRRVRGALGRASGDHVGEHPAIDEATMRLEREPNPDRYTEAAEAVGLEVRRTNEETLRKTLADLLAELGAARVAIAAGDGDLQALSREAAGARDVVERPAPSELFDVDVAITDVEFAVTETGSLAVTSERMGSAAAHVAPPVHVAIVHERQLVADLLDGLRAERFTDGLPTRLVLVTGPSKTADIEGILIEGVHGPGRVVVVLASG